MANTDKFNKKNMQVIAHRGVCRLETENTLAAFIAAGNRSYFGIETDVHVTADKEFAIFHDDHTDRVSNARLTVEECTMAQLQELVLNDRNTGETRIDLRIPKLTDYIKTCKHYEKKAVLELKNRFSRDDIGLMIGMIKALEYLDDVIFISFSWDNLMDIRSYLPGQTVQYLTGEYVTDELLEKLVKEEVDLDIQHSHLTKEVLDYLHDHGRKVNVWTVISVADGEKYADWGVDYITTNNLE